MENHVYRHARLGECVLINARWYKLIDDFVRLAFVACEPLFTKHQEQHIEKPRQYAPRQLVGIFTEIMLIGELVFELMNHNPMENSASGLFGAAFFAR